MKHLKVIRVAVGETDAPWFDNPILECLRYAGLVQVHPNRTPSGGQVFDIFPPKSSWGDSTNWSEMNACRMRSFGLNAVEAPAGEVLEGEVTQ